MRDIGAILDWIGRDPDFDAARVGVYGGSYGGFMTLASLVDFGDRLKAGIATVPSSNLVTLLENTSAHRRDIRRAEYGDERDPKMNAFLREISPLTHAHKIRKPLFVVVGMNDPRVPYKEGEAIVKAVRANVGTAWYLAARDEGHGFVNRANQEYQFAAMTMFWQEHLLK